MNERTGEHGDLAGDNTNRRPQVMPHPDFDGHLERPFANMTTSERLAWLDEVIRLRAETTVVPRGGHGAVSS